MRKVSFIAIVLSLAIVSRAQQQDNSAETNAAPPPPPPPVMLINDKPVGYSNGGPFIDSLVSKYKSAKIEHARPGENAILKDFNSWWNYANQNINLSSDFTGLAPDSTVISKRIFLQLLETGEFYTLKSNLSSHSVSYRLFFFTKADKDIQNTIIQLAANELFYYTMEGKALPSYRFEDIAGRIYNNRNIKGKIIVLKCWFIHCGACVKEFPDLNRLVESYKSRKDILFISLAFDGKEDLKNFLKSHPFYFAVVPLQEKFMTEQLGITNYPTHIIVGKDGTIVKAVDNYQDLVTALKKETSIE